MCGIAGLIAERSLNSSELALLETVNGALVHRGPDSGGIFHDGEVAIAMRRLSIVDLTGGQQPLFSEDKSISLVCNGEIYNYQGLRNELMSKGHRFSTCSDVEVLVHAYEDSPTEFLVRAKGMFALALWDARERKLLLARDRLGEKPIYLWSDNADDGAKRLWFASELHAILKVIPKDKRIADHHAIAEFLTFQYPLDPRTLIAGLNLLPAAHYAEIEARKMELNQRCWWSLSAVPQASNVNPTELVSDLFFQACGRMGTADVPVGVALSGGIDSSLVASVAAEQYPGSLHCFSVGYLGRPQTDERSIAQRFASSLGLPFSEIEIGLKEIVDDFPILIKSMDTPIGDIAAHGYYAVSRAARQFGVPVLLSGLGGDEVFWGYDWVREAVRRNSSNVQTPFWKRIFGRKDQLGSIDSIFGMHDDLRRAALDADQLLNVSISDGHWLNATKTRDIGHRDIAVCEALNRTWLISNCLQLADRLSMAWSIEMRLPFLDIDLIEGVTGLRKNGLGDYSWPHKSLLLKSLGHRLPLEITDRPKQGFTPPVQDWMRAIDNKWSEQTLHDSATGQAGFLDASEQRRLWPSLPISMRYKLLVLDMWVRNVIAA